MEKLNAHNFAVIWGDALQTADRYQYISDWSLSSIWWDDLEDDIPAERIDILGKLWNVAHMSTKEMRAREGVSQRKFADAFGIPARSIENWDGGQRDTTPYIKLLLAHALGIIDLNAIRKIK